MTETQPPDSWKRTLYASAAAQFCCMVGTGFVFPFLPFFISQLGVADPLEVRKWTGIAGSAASITMVIFAPIWGVVGDRYGRKPMVLRAMFAVAFCTALMPFARRPGHLVFLRLLQGALSGTVTANTALVASAVPVERIGFAIGIVYSTAHAGRIIGPSAGGVVAETFGIRTAFWVGAAFVLVAGLLVKFFTHEPPREAAGRDGQPLLSYGGLFARGGFSFVLLAMFQVMLATQLALPLFPLYVEALRGTREGAMAITGGIMSATAVAAVISSGLMGRLSDRWGHRRTLVLSTLAAAVVLTLHAGAQNVAHLFVLRCLLGFCTAAIQPSAGALIRTIVPAHSIGRAFGVAQSVRSAGGAVGPIAGGYLSAQFPGMMGFRVPFLVTGGLMVIVPVFIGLFVRTPSERK